MRKTFLSVCAAVFALLAVSSCGKIEDQFAQIESELETITSRLDALEAALNADVENLATLDASHKALDKAVKDLETALKAADKTNTDEIKALQDAVAALQAKLAGVKVEEKDGAVVITIGENSFTLSQNGVLTIVEVDGVKYWAIVDPKTGEATNLNVKVGHDLKFKVDSETGEVLICYDGDEYVGTGVYAAESSATLIGEVEETDDAVTITIGDATYTLAKWADDKSVLGLSRTDFFVMYEATKVVELTAEDITDYYVMSKPDGWKANFEETTLTVVAPSEDLINLGAAESKGEILIHATTVEGKCKVAKLDVTTGAALTLSYSQSDSVVTVFNALTIKQTMWGETWDDFASVWFGLIPVDEFLTYGSFEAYIATEPEPYTNLSNVASNVGDEPLWYEAGVREEVTISMKLSDIIKNSWSESELVFDPEETYVLWVVHSTDQGYLYDGALYVSTGNVIEFEATNSVYNNVDLAINLFGADGYYIGATNKTYIDEFFVEWVADGALKEDEVFEYYMMNGTMGTWAPPSGPLTKFQGGTASAMGTLYSAAEHNIKLKDILLPDAQNVPDNDYYVWVLPYYVGKDAMEYTFDDLAIFTCETAALTYDENVVATLDVIPGYEQVKITVVPPADGETYYELMSKEYYNTEFVVEGVLDEEAMIKNLKWGSWTDKKYTYTDSWSIEAGEEYILVSYSEAEGKYGPLSSVEFTAPIYDTPNLEQWLFTSTAFDEFIGLPASTTHCLDLGVALPKKYPDMITDPSTLCLAMDLEPMYEDAAGIWQVTNLIFGSYEITPTDAESGVITFKGAEIAYSEYTGTTCTFDLSDIVMTELIVEATLATEEIEIIVQ